MGTADQTGGVTHFALTGRDASATVLHYKGSKRFKTGSGFLWRGVEGAKDQGPGIFVTNAHVVEGEASRLGDDSHFELVFAPNQKLFAKPLIIDRQLDLALLQVDPKAAEQTGLPAGLLSRAVPSGGIVRELHASTYAALAEPVLSVGTPGAGGSEGSLGVLHRVVTSGSVAGHSFHRGLGASEVLLADVTVNPGMSGGPLLSAINGQVIGVNALGFRAETGKVETGDAVYGWLEGLAAFVPAYWIYDLWSEWESNPKLLYPRRGDIGIREDKQMVRAVIPLEMSESCDGAVTAVGVDCEPPSGSPAQLVGVQKNDKIFEFDGIRIDDPSRLIGALTADTIGCETKMRVLRDNSEIVELWVTPSEFDAAP
jgi:S1-C subfamily serine protease